MRRSSATPTIAAGDLEAIGALESGNWRTALRVLGEGQVADAYVGANLRTVARAMAFRAAGDHSRAWETLGIAAANVARRQPGLPVLPADGDDVVRLALPPAYAGPAYRMVRLVWREQSELGRLRRLAADRPSGMPQDRHILVLAFVEYLCWLELDLETSLTPPTDDAQVYELRDRRREGFLRSATDLRHLAMPRAGTMTKTVWGRAGGYHGLRRLALLELAEWPEPPWTDSPATCPARSGARMAWAMARAA
ncbi:hypothetical protein [Kribbella shirazensis]|uniref:Uncharacterized protein n=1 Tax=Kribbella shirazensis TaxID=1105143 RepID=A0A7X5V5Z2_9ACTN|nr:hypothetical protein [Kribbella shirazensis]NIK54796.1 hypothetical protein [Kribbella shirazensis]